MIQPPKDSEFPMLDEWFKSFNKKRKSLPLIQFSKAARYLKKLNSENEKHFVLHADFHHENILSSEREDFLAIDPKGMVGNVGYDLAVFLNNHAIWIRSEKNFEKKLNIAVEKFSEAFNISEKKLKQWAFAQQVLSAWWHFEDGGKDWQTQLQLAVMWEKI